MPEDLESYNAKRRERWDALAAQMDHGNLLRRGYQAQLKRLYGQIVPRGARVLEAGCAGANLLDALQPARGVGIDFSPRQVEIARRRHPHLDVHTADVHALDLGETFDYIVASDLFNDLYDVQLALERLRRHTAPHTRLVLNIYNHLWESARRAAQRAGLVGAILEQNWLSSSDLNGILSLAGFEIVWSSHEILLPLAVPVAQPVANRVLARLPLLRHAALTYFVVARPARTGLPHARVSVIVPARNEAGHIPQIPERVPDMGLGTEIVFVEGHSKDDTWDAIQSAIAAHPDREMKALRQTGTGKGDAVRAGFAAASGDLLMILDADLTVAPEDLPRFYDVWRDGHGEMINGVRLVYPMERRAMRLINKLGNKFFSLAFTWLLGQHVKDTLCGTKVLARADYNRIAAGRDHFGRLDPFGDFDLLFGAARLKLKIVDLPVRYRERVYGTTNIQRWRHGWLLLRMVWLAVRRLKFI